MPVHTLNDWLKASRPAAFPKARWPAPQTSQEWRKTKAEFKALQGKHEVLQRELRRKESAPGRGGIAAGVGADKKIPGAVGGRGLMTCIQQRQTLLELIQEACNAGSRLESACAQIGLSARTVSAGGAHKAKAEIVAWRAAANEQSLPTSSARPSPKLQWRRSTAMSSRTCRRVRSCPA